MNTKMIFCFIEIALLIFTLILFGLLFRKKLYLREILTGSVIYVLFKGAIFQAAFSFVIQMLGQEMPLFGQAVISVLLEAVILSAGYWIYYKFFYSAALSEEVAVSSAFGAMILDAAVSVGYPLLSYGLIFQAMGNDTINSVLEPQGMNAETISMLIQRFESITYASLGLMLIKGLSIICIHLLVSLCVYQWIKNKNRKMFWAAFLAVAMFDGICNVLSVFSEIAALTGSIVLIVLLMVCRINGRRLVRDCNRWKGNA